MKHLSVRTTEIEPVLVRRFSCAYQMGDSFVLTTADVDCPTCLKQIAQVQS